MRRHAPLAALLVALAAVPATAFERREISPGDRLLISITDVEPTHEYTLRLPRDASFRVKVKALKRSALLPARGLLDRGYEMLDLAPFGRSGGRTAPLPASGTYRLILQGAQGTRGDMRVDTALRPLKKARLKVRDDDTERPTELVFGALPGYALSYSLSWRGPEPVRVSEILGPDDVELVTAEPVREKASSARGKGYTTRVQGDHVVRLDVPPGTERWDLKVKIKGAGTTGQVRDLRVAGEPVPDGITLGTYALRLEDGGEVVVLPRITVVGEAGGPDGVLVAPAVRSDGSGVPVVMAPNGCRVSVPPGEPLPTSYTIDCADTHDATLGSIVRDAGGAMLSYVLSGIVTPDGGGRSVVSGVTFSATGSPTGWTEVRTFDGTGAVHRLVVSGAELFPNSAFTYTVLHTTPAGLTRRYDFLPFR